MCGNESLQFALGSDNRELLLYVAMLTLVFMSMRARTDHKTQLARELSQFLISGHKFKDMVTVSKLVTFPQFIPIILQSNSNIDEILWLED